MDKAKRYDIVLGGTMPIVTYNELGQHVSAMDHERIVAQLGQELKIARERMEKFKEQRDIIINAMAIDTLKEMTKK